MSGDNDSFVTYKVVEDVAFITLDHPPVNIMTQAMMDEIADCLDSAIGFRLGFERQRD